MRAMWRTLRQTGRQPRRLRRSSVHDRRRRGDARARSAATGRSRASSSPATSRATTSPTTRACCARRASCCASASAGRAWIGDLRLESRGGVARGRARARRPGRSTPPASIETTRSAAGRASGSPRRRVADVAAGAQARRHGADRVHRSHRRVAKTATVTPSEDPAIEVVPVEARAALDARRSERSASAGSAREVGMPVPVVSDSRRGDRPDRCRTRPQGVARPLRRRGTASSPWRTAARGRSRHGSPASSSPR